MRKIFNKLLCSMLGHLVIKGCRPETTYRMRKHKHLCVRCGDMVKMK